MYKQIVVVFALVAASQASVLTPGLGLASPALTLSAAPAIAVARAEPVDIHPQYTYSYGVQDPNTGDVKGQTETRDGDVVRGQYSLIDSDGTRRVVDYAADSLNGFNAVVRKEPLAVATPVVTKTIAPAVVRTVAVPAIEPAVIRTVAAPAIAPAVVRTVAAPAIAPAVVRTIASPAVATLAAPASSVTVQDVSGRILVGSAPWALNGLNLGLTSLQYK